MIPVYGYTYEPSAHLLVTDEDAADFLQSQFSNDLNPFKAGSCTYGLWLDVKGKVIADSFVCCESETEFRIFSEYSSENAISDTLERHIIADDVAIEHLPKGYAIALIGNEAAAILQSFELQVPDEGTFQIVDGIYIYNGRRSLEPSFELWCDSVEKFSELEKHLVQAGVEFVSSQQVEQMRLEAGIPRIPSEIGPSDLPGEGSLINDGVSLTKGCYLGQEVVARMHNIGRAQRALFLISGSGKMPSCPTALFNKDSKQVGELRSAFSAGEIWKGVALLKIRYAAAGDLLGYESGNVTIEGLFSANKLTNE